MEGRYFAIAALGRTLGLSICFLSAKRCGRVAILQKGSVLLYKYSSTDGWSLGSIYLGCCPVRDKSIPPRHRTERFAIDNRQVLRSPRMHISQLPMTAANAQPEYPPSYPGHPSPPKSLHRVPGWLLLPKWVSRGGCYILWLRVWPGQASV